MALSSVTVQDSRTGPTPMILMYVRMYVMGHGPAVPLHHPRSHFSYLSVIRRGLLIIDLDGVVYTMQYIGNEYRFYFF